MLIQRFVKRGMDAERDKCRETIDIKGGLINGRMLDLPGWIQYTRRRKIIEFDWNASLLSRVVRVCAFILLTAPHSDVLRDSD